MGITVVRATSSQYSISLAILSVTLPPGMGQHAKQYQAVYQPLGRAGRGGAAGIAGRPAYFSHVH
jgi:hypothetical protein